MRRVVQAAIAALGVAGCLLSGCSAGESAGQAMAGVEACNTVVVIGAGARDCVPSLGALPEPLAERLATMCSIGGKLDVVTVSGTPQAMGAVELASSAATDARRRADAQAAIDGIENLLLHGCLAEQPEADVLEALRLAGEELAFMSGEGAIVVIDSGVSTTGLLSLAGNVSLGCSIEEVIAYLEANDAVPDLEGVSVEWYYLGQTIHGASGQQALPPSDVAWLKELYSELIAAAGGHLTVHGDVLSPASGSSSGSKTLPFVTAVTPSTVPSFDEFLGDSSSAPVVLTETMGVKFQPGSATEFTDDDRALATIGELAASIVEAGASVSITGTCASDGDAEYRRDLSLRRAEHVAELLVNEGVPQDRIVEVAGIGSDDPDRVEDIGPNGDLLPGPASLNRKVIVRAVEAE